MIFFIHSPVSIAVYFFFIFRRRDVVTAVLFSIVVGYVATAAAALGLSKFEVAPRYMFYGTGAPLSLATVMVTGSFLLICSHALSRFLARGFICEVNKLPNLSFTIA